MVPHLFREITHNSVLAEMDERAHKSQQGCLCEPVMCM